MSFIKDLVTLDVITVTGNLKVKKDVISGTTNDDSNPDGQVIDFDTLFSRSSGKLVIDADMEVVAATHIEIDRDTFTFVKQVLSENDKELLRMHMDSVNAASAARADIIARVMPKWSRLGNGNENEA
jgi:hypothetical protein